MSSPVIDPRPLPGEPLSLDLLNTRWMTGDGPRDLLAEPDGLTVWLAANKLAGHCPQDAAAREALLAAREALAVAVRDPGAPSREALDGLNAVLAHGRVRRLIGPDGRPAEEVETDLPAWRAPWIAVNDYLELLAADPGRIRACAHDRCVLHFFDTSQNRRRRWCSMAVCGNRAKASRHHARTKEPRPE
ncbi:CGNR zinc finger domain-containing protein [Streptomyces sp. NPDC088733]|uniref:CGNR zinc finger domain-containing protein n=1 Tax=Streptomyces sp. NPDC088733 TaxID=3365880 RepID=UPI00380AB822